MNSHRKIATITGSLFLIAMFSSLIGGGIIESIVSAPNFLQNTVDRSTQLWSGVLLELLNGLAVMGIAVTLYTTIKKYNESLAVGYLGFRIVESIFCTIPAIKPLALITLGEKSVTAGSPAQSYLQAIGSSLLAERAEIMGLLVPIFFSLSALLFYIFLFQTKVLPRFISIWGFIGVASIMILNIFKIELPTGMMLAAPIIFNEIFLGFWLIIKGFNPANMEQSQL